MEALNDSHYYVISPKWTYPDSFAFTLWGPNNNGYCWYQEWAGVYSKEQIEDGLDYYHNGYGALAIPKTVADELFLPCIYNDKLVHLLPINDVTKQRLGLIDIELDGGMSNILAHEVQVMPNAGTALSLGFSQVGER